jgi:hypothetical protein
MRVRGGENAARKKLVSTQLSQRAADTQGHARNLNAIRARRSVWHQLGW